MPDEHELIRGVQAVMLAAANAQPLHDRLASLPGSQRASPEMHLAAKAATDAIWAAVRQSRAAVKTAPSTSWRARDATRVRGVPDDVGHIIVAATETFNAALFCVELVEDHAVQLAGAIRQLLEFETL